MGAFTNVATLSYQGNVMKSNTIKGELQEIISMTKMAVMDDYTAGDDITYVISITNSSIGEVGGLKLTDDLGAYTFGTGKLVPLDYVTGSLRYYQNGIPQPLAELTIDPGAPLIINGIVVPGRGNVMLIYEAEANAFAPLGISASIINHAAVEGGDLSEPMIATETVYHQTSAALTISKCMTPDTVAENGQLSYTFVIQNAGNTTTVQADEVSLVDTFRPRLGAIEVQLDGAVWDAANYTYEESTGVFQTKVGSLVVPAATYQQDSTGVWVVTPGVRTLRITGTV